METIKTVAKTSEAYMQNVMANPYVMAILKISLTLYAAQLAPRLPESVSSLFSNTFVKIIALFIIAYVSERDFQLSIILAIVFVFGSNFASGRGLFESFSNFSTDYKPFGDAKLIEPKTMLYPGCAEITVAELLGAFEGDNIKLQDTVQFAFKELLAKANDKPTKEKLMYFAYATGLPHNVPLTDENAPLYATILMYHGFKIGTKCIAPQQQN